MDDIRFVKRYNAFVHNVELDSIIIRELRATGPSSLTRPRKARIIIDKLDPPFFSVQEGRLVAFEWSVAATISHGTPDKREDIASLQAVVRVMYRLRSGSVKASADDVLDVFAKRNVPVNVWPWLRRLFASMCYDMGLNTPLLPLWRAPNG